MTAGRHQIHHLTQPTPVGACGKGRSIGIRVPAKSPKGRQGGSKIPP